MLITFSPNTKAKSDEVNDNFLSLANGENDTDNNSILLTRGDYFNDWAQSGLNWSLTSGLDGSLSSGVAYVKDSNGLSQRVEVLVTSKTFTASKDTYVMLSSSGVLSYSEQTNGATPPSYTAYTMPLALVITDGSAITKIVNLSPRNPNQLARACIDYGALDTITLPNIPSKNAYMVKMAGIASGGTLDTSVRFNNDSGTNYAYFSSSSMAAGAGTTSANGIPGETGATNDGQLDSIIMKVDNIATQEKTVFLDSLSVDGTGGANQLSSLEAMGKWANSSVAINRVDWVNSAGTGDFGVGSEIYIKEQ